MTTKTTTRNRAADGTGKGMYTKVVQEFRKQLNSLQAAFEDHAKGASDLFQGAAIRLDAADTNFKNIIERFVKWDDFISKHVVLRDIYEIDHKATCARLTNLEAASHSEPDYKNIVREIVLDMPEIHHPAHVIPKGCVCPVGAEASCKNALCGRK